MAWKLLPTDYTDAVWSGLKRYTQVDNSDGTVSFNDVTTYTNKEKSFFGAKDANRMNEALNYIMSMLENGTNLYEEFQTYFTTQKELFKSSGDSSYQELTQYFVNLKAQGDSSLAQIEKTYEVTVAGAVENAAAELAAVRSVDGEPIAPARVRLLRKGKETAELSVTIHEGKNRQIRRMCAAVGLHVKRLRRVQEHTLSLGALPEGGWRELTADEVRAFEQEK